MVEQSITFTPKFDIIVNNNYLLITTPHGARSIVKRVWAGFSAYIIYLTIDNKTQLLRCIERESMQNNPNYSEICCRFISDEEDFSENKLKEFVNIHRIDTTYSDPETCLKEWWAIYNRIASCD